MDSTRLERFLAHPNRALYELAWPVTIGMSLQMLYALADLFFVGQIDGNALAAVAFNIPVLFVITAFVVGIGSGLTSVAARASGARDTESFRNTSLHGLLFGAFCGGLFALCGTFFGPQILSIAGVPSELEKTAFAYLQTVCLGSPFAFLAGFSRSLWSGQGDTRTPALISGAGTVLNILLDPLFIFTLDWGVAGAARATVLSQMTVGFTYLAFFRNKKLLSTSSFRWTPKLLQELLKTGLPASASLGIMALSGILMNQTLSHYSSAAVAAFQLVQRIEMLFLLPVTGMSHALLTLTGMFFGAGRKERLHMLVITGISQTMLVALLGTCVAYIFSETIAHSFTDSRSIAAHTAELLRLLSPVWMLIGLDMGAVRILQGLGRGLPLLFLTALRTLLVPVPFALLCRILDFPLQTLWLGLPAGVALSSLFAFVLLVRMRRKDF